MITPHRGLSDLAVLLSARIHNSVIRTKALASREREILDERASDSPARRPRLSEIRYKT